MFSSQSEHIRADIRVCPVDAINPIKHPLDQVIEAECFGCGLCVLQCPIGAIEIVDSRARVRDDLLETQDVEVLDDFEQGREEMLSLINWTDNEIDQIAQKLAESARELRQSEFYPLTERIFRALGFDTWLPARGDTSNRIDLLIIAEGLAIPVEVKSRTETSVINVKAIQQAFENRIVLDERDIRDTNCEFTSLVVGYDYAPDRSDVSELVVDINNAFGVKIGMVSVKSLYVLLLKRFRDKTFNPVAPLLNLVGPLK